MSYDVIIIGAGPAGVTASIHIARAGSKVLLVDKAEEKLIGYRTGGGVIKIHDFSETGFSRPSGDELVSFLDTFNVCSPTGKTRKVVKHPAMVVDRLLLNQRLLGYAREAGVDIRGGTEFKSLNLDGDTVKGITTASGDSFDAKVVVDAGGLHDGVKKQLPDSMKIEKNINNKYVANVYVEMIKNPDYSSTELTSYLAVDNGYIWWTPVEIGYGSFDHSINVKDKLHSFISEHNLKVDTDSSLTSYGKVVVRQNLPNMVGNGFVAVGDAACMVSPMDGAGITSSMVGSKLAAEVISECLQAGDVSQNALWDFNCRYNKKYGSVYAYMDMLRRGVIGLEPDDIDFAYKQNVITDKDVLDSMTGAIADVSVMDKAQRAFRGLRRPHILLRMETCMSKSKELKELYRHYPADPEGLDEWSRKVQSVNESFQ